MTRLKPSFKVVVFVFAAALAGTLTHAATLLVANQGDATSMDPHSLNESLQLSITGNVYEPLVGRDKKLGLEPVLATQWSRTAPTVWRFELRRNVKLHDGTPLSADDVVFSFGRAAGEGSDMKGYTSSIKQVRKVGEHTVEIETTAPFPIPPDVISLVYVMSNEWCEDDKAERPVDKRKGIENTASFRAKGTGPYRLRERQPTTRSIFVPNPSYWGKVEGNVDEVIVTPIGNDATRVTAMLSGEIDVMEPVPLQDAEAAKKLLADAGYPSGFEVGMSCPNDRYVNDGEICQAVATNLARIGVKINLQAESKATCFPKILRRDMSLHALGWTPGTYDAHNALSNLMATPNDKGQGAFNLGAHSTAKLDELTAKVQSETDQSKRNATIAEAFELHADDIGHIPLHQQALAWAMKKNVSLVQLADNFMPFKYTVVT